MDWQKSGKALRARILHDLEGRGFLVDVEFTKAHRAFVRRGDPSRLSQYFLSDRPLGRSERLALAHLFTRSDAKEKKGRPRNEMLRRAARMASNYYGWWHHENQELGINDHGHRMEMKNEAARIVVEDFFAFEFDGRSEDMDAFVEAVRDLMDKPRHRRES